MPYYQDLNILFVHIPKTGGSSIEGFLKEKNNGKQTLYSGVRNKRIPNEAYQKYSLQHQFYSTLYQYRKALDINFNHKLSVIAIVRNPYHRLISGLLWKKMIKRDTTKQAIYKAAKAYLASDNLDNHNTPQYKFLIDEYGMLYRHIRVFRTETLTQDVKRYGFQDYNGRKTANTYWKFYNQDLLDLVNDVYKKDFDYLGYTQIMSVANSNEFHERSVNEKPPSLQPITTPSTIFIAIPSYVDLALKATILDSIRKATHSTRLHFGVCLQWDKKEGLEKDCIDSLTNECNIRIDKYFYKASGGVGWARNKAQQLYNKETYFLQIDAHTKFIDKWDELLIADFEDLKQRVEKPIISYFPPAYRKNKGGYSFNYANELDKINIPVITKVTKEYCFEYHAHNEMNTGFKNIKTPVLDGSFIFTEGAWAKEILQDPAHYYLGEEVALSLRSFTRGYDFYSPKQIVAWHGSHRSPRRKHYEEHSLDIVKIKHEMSMLRLKALLEEKDRGIYGLSKKRSLNDFRTTTGVDIVNKQIDSLKMKHYTIFGERNSGTNYLATVLNAHITLQFTKKFGFKHWFIKNHFPRGRANGTTDNECLAPLKNSADTLFIFIVRNPYDWCGAMKVKPYHIKETDHSSVYNFISKKYISYENSLPSDHGPTSISPWYIDEKINKYFIDEAANLIELRNLKNNHFYALRNKVKNFHIIRQEYLKEDIQEMIKKFNLAIKSEELLVNYEKPKKYHLDEKSRQFIDENLNNKIDNTFYSNNSERTSS